MKKYVVFSTDFRPYKGGIAEFMFNIANFLNKENLLEKVISYTPQKGDEFGYSVCLSNLLRRKRNNGKRLGDSFFLFRKVNTFIHKIILYYYAYIDLKPFLKKKSNVKILIGTFYTYDNGIFIDMCRFLNFEYEILFHGLDIIRISKQLSRQFKKDSKHANRLIFNSKATKHLFYEKFSSFYGKTEVIYPLVDTKKILNEQLYTRLELQNRWNIILENKYIISSVTALVKRKGIHIAISALSKLTNKYPDCLFIVGGDGPEKIVLEQLVKKLGLEKNVYILGLISDKEKWSLLEYSEIFILPSSGLGDNDWEGFGISYIEASLFQNIVIGGEHGGIVEAISNNNTGYLLKFDEKNSDEKLYDLLNTLISNNVSDRKMGQIAKKYVMDNFDIKKFGGKF